MTHGDATIVWFRLDLRLEDNPALRWAAERGGPVVPIFVWAPDEEGDWPPGAASRWWLHRSLASLAAALGKRGSRLILRRGPSGTALADVARATGARAVAWNRRTEPALAARDARVAGDLAAVGFEIAEFNAHLLFEPEAVRTRAGQPFQVFTPFWKACLALDDPPGTAAAPRALPPPDAWPVSASLASFGLEPSIDWAGGLGAAWEPGEAGARRRLAAFVDGAIDDYPSGRDLPGSPGTSRLSPHLHFGEIGPRQVWRAVRERPGTAPAGERSAAAWLREIGWREFAHHLMHHFPRTAESPLRPAFERFPWRRDDGVRRAWERGRTGYPIVDAGMRELWTTGWMHNRVRMIAASFLVKDLLLSWRDGARWFWDTLVDADLANNTLGWQWSAGCGADAAPYFRIFNPTLQGHRFDPDGRYVGRFVPELAGVPRKHLHAPWEAPAPPPGYPAPIVDHRAARDRALAAFATVSGGGGAGAGAGGPARGRGPRSVRP